jgi:hypothetical protein
MKGNSEGIVSAFAFEFAPAAIFGSAVGFASAIAFSMPQLGVIPLSAGFGAFALSWLALRRFGAGSKSFPLADFNQSELEREFANLAEEMQQGGAGELILEDELPPLAEGELMLEDQLPASEEDSRVIRLFDPRTQTAGEMHARIDHHLRTTPRPPLSDATQELHDALAALRQSLR